MLNFKTRRILLLVSFFTIALGFLVSLGWLFNIQLLKAVLPDSQSMKMNTAISFILAGTVFSFIITERWNVACLLMSWLLVLFGISVLLETIFNWNIGIDELVVRDSGTADQLAPGRPSPLTALCFSLLGTAFLFIGSGNVRFKKTAQYFL